MGTLTKTPANRWKDKKCVKVDACAGMKEFRLSNSCGPQLTAKNCFDLKNNMIPKDQKDRSISPGGESDITNLCQA